MMNDISGKKVLITGSSSGMGFETALLAAKLGAYVGLHGMQSASDAADAIAKVKAAGAKDCKYYQYDLTKPNNCKALVADFIKDFGAMHVLVANAGGLGGRRPIGELDVDFYNSVNDLNITSAVFTIDAAIPHLKKSAPSSVVITGSIAAHEGGGPGAALYGATKSYLHAAMRTWVKEQAGNGIRFNCIAPGFIETRFHDDKSADVKATIAGKVPMKRAGKPSEVAPSIMFLASEECSSYITGSVIDINGGLLFAP